MPDKPVTVATYAAGASLAAITLFYVFGPTFFLDGDSGRGGKKKTIVGLSNQANDCFINSVLQALSGLGELRLYLIRELHRRRLDGSELYDELPELKPNDKPDRIKGLQQGIITQSLKQMLDALNERPIYKKTISARPFIESLEKAFRTRISRSQQDAQEFLQVVAERLCDEFHAGERARQRVLTKSPHVGVANVSEGPVKTDPSPQTSQHNAVGGSLNNHAVNLENRSDNGNMFPMEGQLESQIECQHCNFQYKPSKSSFVTLTLNVPQQSATSLSNCFDGLLKTEHIEDFRCDRCRIEHAIQQKKRALERGNSEDRRAIFEREIATLTEIYETDPEKDPKDVDMPPSEDVPRRRISKHMRIVSFPKIIAIHLSRSIFDSGQYSTKNAAKVSFPERLRLGGLLEEKWYKLLGIVCHKGSHNSGHYESFRRQHIYPPFATPDAFSGYAGYSRSASPIPSNLPSPRLIAASSAVELSSSSSIIPRPSSSPTPSGSSASLSTPGSRSTSKLPPSVTSAPRTTLAVDDQPMPRRSVQSERSVDKRTPPIAVSANNDALRLQKRKKAPERWWRISDDKVKECRTSDVLGMQREVYLLFYELERYGGDEL